jgi:tetratricopeptide (TPR) repeat protein
MKLMIISIVTVGVLLSVIAGAEEGKPPLYVLDPRCHPGLQNLVGPASDILKNRQAAEVLYFLEKPFAMERDFVTLKDGSVAQGRAKFLRTPKIVILGTDGRPLPVAHPVPDAATRKRVAADYRRVIAQLTVDKAAGKTHSVPFDFLGVVLFMAGDHGIADLPDYDLDEVRKAYKASPSDLRVLAYLELALIERALGRKDEYRKVLAEALIKTNLSEIDRRADVKFRRHLAGRYNFARPECCLLFQAAEDARENKRFDEAQKHYKTLIERAPGSPFAWEALAKTSLLPEVKPEETKRLTDILLQTYPLVWGCQRPKLKMDKEAFAAQLPALLKIVITKDPAVRSFRGYPFR